MKKEYLLFIIAFIIMLGCQKDNPTEPEKTAPVLSQLSVPDTLFLSWDETQKMTVRAEDPQGIQDIKCVLCEVWPSTVHAPGKIDTLSDDGSEGDIIAGDGVYCKILDERLTNGESGTFSLVFKAEDRKGEQSNQLTRKIEVVKGIKNPPPVIHRVSAPDSIDIAVEQDYLITCLVSDAKGQSDITLVTCDISLSTSHTPFFSDTLADDGTGGDAVAADSLYSFILSSNFSNGKVRTYYLYFNVYDSAGNQGSMVQKILRTVNSTNEPPIISTLVAPDTMYIPPIDVIQVLLTLDVSDAQGLADIRKVFFNSYKPDGSPASGNPFDMLDDGGIVYASGFSSGDKAANDGTYSLKINLTSDNKKGTYRFLFEAVDYSNAKSNQIIHYIVVE